MKTASGTKRHEKDPNGGSSGKGRAKNLTPEQSPEQRQRLIREHRAGLEQQNREADPTDADTILKREAQRVAGTLRALANRWELEATAGPHRAPVTEKRRRALGKLLAAQKSLQGPGRPVSMAWLSDSREDRRDQYSEVYDKAHQYLKMMKDALRRDRGIFDPPMMTKKVLALAERLAIYPRQKSELAWLQKNAQHFQRFLGGVGEDRFRRTPASTLADELAATIAGASPVTIHRARCSGINSRE